MTIHVPTHSHICQHCNREYLCPEMAPPDGDTDEYCGWHKFVMCNRCAKQYEKASLAIKLMKEIK